MLKLYENIRLFRLNAGLTQAELAQKAGYTDRSSIAKIERGVVDLPQTKIEQFAAIFGVSPGALMGWESCNAIPAPASTSSIPEEVVQVVSDLNDAGIDELVDYGRYLLEKPEFCLEEGEHRTVYVAGPAPIPHIIPGPAEDEEDTLVEFRIYDQPAAAGLGNYLDDVPPCHTELLSADMIPKGADMGIRISGDSMEPKIPDGCTALLRSSPVVESGKIGIFVLNGSAYCKVLRVDRANREIHLVSLNKAYEDVIVTEQDSLRTLGEVLGVL